MDAASVLELWWVYFGAVCISTLAISTGVSGALFFAPFFLLAVGLPPAQALGAGLMTQIFGTGSGAFSYARQGVVDGVVVRSLLLVTVPCAMAGAALALAIDPGALRAVLGAGLLALAAFLLWTNLRRARAATRSHPTPRRFREKPAPYPLRGGNLDEPNAVIRARDGAEYRYTRPGRAGTQAMGAAGALTQGFMGAGLPEVTTTQLLLRGRLPPRVAVATSVTTLWVTVVFAAAIHAVGGEPAWHVVVWSIPGALTGAQFGARLQARLSPTIAERALAAVFAAVGVVVLAVG